MIHMSFYRLVFLFIVGVGIFALAGCSSQEEPRRYKAPKEEPAMPVRISPVMGSMPPAGGSSVRLAYETPEGWETGQVGGMRKAAFVVRDGERKVEITAIDLSARAGELLPNVNRWREQIKLAKITQDELNQTAQPIQVAGVDGHYVELMGSGEADKRQAILAVVAIHGGKSWFFKLWGDPDLALREKERFQQFVKSVRFTTPQHAGSGAPHGGSSLPHGGAAPAGAVKSSLTYDAPDGWMPGKASRLRKASFVVENDGKKVEITAIDLAAGGGALLPNVNLWRRQIQLEKITQDELDQIAFPFQVAGMDGDFVELLGPDDANPRQAILGVVVNRQGRTWFFKLWGDAELALREKDRFQEFVKSVRFGEAGGAENGD